MAVRVRPQDDYSRFDYLIEIQLEEFRRYIFGLDDSIEKSKLETKKWVDEEIWPDKNEAMPPMAMEVILHVEVFTPNLFYKSTLTALYSFFESSLRELAEVEREKRKYKLKIDDIKGNGISLYKDYFTKVMGIELSSLEITWLKIDKVRIVRNSIVHNESENSERKKQVEKICNENNYLQYAGQVHIKSSKYLIEFTNNIFDYINGILTQLRQI